MSGLVGDAQLVQVAGQAGVVLDQVDHRVVLVPQRTQVGGDGGVVQPGGHRQGPQPERHVSAAGFHRHLPDGAEHPAFPDAGPVGVPVVFEQARGRSTSCGSTGYPGRVPRDRY